MEEFQLCAKILERKSFGKFLSIFETGFADVSSSTLRIMLRKDDEIWRMNTF